MTAWMPPPLNPRKRPASGLSPVPQTPNPMQQPNFPAQQPQLQNNQFANLAWTQGANSTVNPAFPDLSYNMAGNFSANNVSNPQYTQSVPATSNQLARRPMSRQLVPTASRGGFENSNEWSGGLGDDGTFDQQSLNGMAENDSIERLEERAIIAKREAQSKRKQIPPFVQKLSSFLDDGKNTELIRWSDRGDSFVVLDEDEFAKTLIPELFKHNNYASFVRQLNMYGFHKRVGLSDNSMKASERKNKSPSEYYNPYFKRGHPNLLWLINKPKSGSAQKKKGRTKTEEGADESDEDNKDGVEETFSGNYGQGHQGYEPPRAISVAPESGPLQRQELTLVQKQLRDIQNQQNAISNAIARLRKEHHDLYQQAVAFQTLHDRHESSINAILTFLATVYNRSLDGQGVPNIGQMFGNAMAQDQMHQGSVVDLGNLNQQGQTPGNLSPLRRAQRLIMAPPNSNQAMSAVSTPSTQNAGSMSSAGNYRMSSQTPKQSGAIEELFDKSPSAKSPSVKPEVDPTQPQPQQNIMELINNTNAQAPLSANKMDFPDVLHHYENANGNSPLTNEQRNDMLQLIANTSGGSNNNINALVSPAPPPNPTLEQLGYTQQEIDELIRMQQDQDAKIHNVSAALGPLTPSGSIPGLDNGAQYFNNGDVSPLGSSNNLDLDQFLDSGAYYTNGDGGTDFGYDAFGNPNVGTAGAFDFGLDNAADGMSGLDQGKVVGGSSGAPSPTVFEEQAGAGSSPNRKRRKG